MNLPPYRRFLPILAFLCSFPSLFLYPCLFTVGNGGINHCPRSFDDQFSGSQDGCGSQIDSRAYNAAVKRQDKGQVPEAGVLCISMTASAVSFMMMAASECFCQASSSPSNSSTSSNSPFSTMLTSSSRLSAPLPKSREYRLVSGASRGGLLVVPGNPIAVLRLYEYGIGMNGFVFGIDKHSGSDIGLKR